MTGKTTVTQGQSPHFLYAEESGLALFQNRQTGRKFWIDQEHWNDLVECVRSGWTPENRKVGAKPAVPQ